MKMQLRVENYSHPLSTCWPVRPCYKVFLYLDGLRLLETPKEYKSPKWAKRAAHKLAQKLDCEVFSDSAELSRP